MIMIFSKLRCLAGCAGRGSMIDVNALISATGREAEWRIDGV
jgi:hypothetical protein